MSRFEGFGYGVSDWGFRCSGFRVGVYEVQGFGNGFFEVRVAGSGFLVLCSGFARFGDSGTGLRGWGFGYNVSVYRVSGTGLREVRDFRGSGFRVRCFMIRGFCRFVVSGLRFEDRGVRCSGFRAGGFRG